MAFRCMSVTSRRSSALVAAKRDRAKRRWTRAARPAAAGPQGTVTKGKVKAEQCSTELQALLKGLARQRDRPACVTPNKQRLQSLMGLSRKAVGPPILQQQEP